MKRVLALMMTIILAGSVFGVTSIPVKAATDLTISGVTTAPNPVNVNGDFNLKFILKNESADNITKIFMEILNSEFQFVGGGTTKLILETLNSGNPSGLIDVDTIKRVGGSETSIPVKFTYTKGGVTVTQMDSISINATISSGTTPPSTPFDPTTIVPSLGLTDETFPILYQGARTTVTLSLTNRSVYQAKNITITPDFTQVQAAGIRVESTSFSPALATIDGQKKLDFTMSYIVDDTVAEGNYPIDLNIKYINVYGSEFTQKLQTYVKVVKDTNKAHQVKVELSEVSPAEVKAGQDLKLSIKMTNGESKISSPKIELLEVPAGMSLIGGKDMIEYDFLNGRANTSFDATYRLAETMTTGWYTIKVKYSYLAQEGYRLNRQTTLRVFINEKQKEVEKVSNASASIDNVNFPTSVNQDRAFKVSFDFMNTGDKKLKNIKLALVDNPIFLPRSSSLVQVKELDLNGKTSATFELVATGDALIERNYPLSFKVTYTYEDNKEVVEESLEQFMGIYVIKKPEVKDEATSNKGIPKIIIDAYSVDPMIVEAGSEFDLGLTFLNAHASQSIYNIKVFMTATETSATSQSNIFIPVNSSNTFFIDSISAKGKVDKSIRLYAVPDAQPKTYTIQVNFEYEDSEGKPLTATELVGVNVQQPSKVEMSDFNLPTDVMAGEGVPIYFDIYNTGKVKVFNLIVKAEGNFNLEPMSKYIGNFEPGYQDYFDGFMMLFEPGQVEGKIILSYDDPSGENFIIEKPFSINVMEGYVDPGMGGEFPEYPEFPMEEEKGFNWLFLIIPAVVLAIGAVATVIILKKRKAKKEGMMFDED